MTTEKYIVFGSDSCPYCRKAYKLLASKRKPFEKRDPSGIPKSVKATTIPQIFGLINNKGTYIGGFAELENFFKKESNH